MPWFEDISVGEKTDLGSYTFEADDMIAFATKFDPQPFHIDEGAAKASPYGGLIASGWHTCSVWMKLMVKTRIAEKARKGEDDGSPPGGPSPGFLELKWPTPVRVGDRITYSTEVIEKVDLKSRPNLGIVRSLNTGRNQNGELVMSFIGQGLMQKREPV